MTLCGHRNLAQRPPRLLAQEPLVEEIGAAIACHTELGKERQLASARRGLLQGGDDGARVVLDVGHAPLWSDDRDAQEAQRGQRERAPMGHWRYSSSISGSGGGPRS